MEGDEDTLYHYQCNRIILADPNTVGQKLIPQVKGFILNLTRLQYCFPISFQHISSVFYKKLYNCYTKTKLVNKRKNLFRLYLKQILYFSLLKEPLIIIICKLAFEIKTQNKPFRYYILL